jgi:hypothetical protein
VESYINSKFNQIKLDIENITKLSENNISEILDKLDEINKRLNRLEERFNKFTEKINQNLSESQNNLQKEKISLKKNKLYIDSSKNDDKKKKLNDFITLYENENLGFSYYEPYEIEEENQLIVEKIKNTIFENFLPEKENCENEMAGKFLSSVGGISRISLCIANDAFSELFNEYKRYLEDNNEWLTFNHEEDRRKLSIWAKKFLNEEQFYEYYSKSNENKMQKYLYSNEEKNNQILLELFRDLIKLYTKCLLSYPLVEVNFTNNNCKFENSIMFDIIMKGKKKLVNFCYLPSLKSNGKLIKGGYFYVFTFIENKTYQIKGNLFEDEIAVQNTRLYSLPNFYNMTIDPEVTGDFEIKALTNPKIPSELKPIYKLTLITKEKTLELEENNTGIFQIDEKYLNKNFCINYTDYREHNKKSNIFKISLERKNIIIIKNK